MAHVIPRLPDAQIAALSAGYRAEMAAKRRMTLGGLVILVLLAALAAIVAEVDIRLLIANIDKFTSYFGRLFYLDTGASVFTDIGEWFWGLSKWSRQLFDTLLIAYLGTLGGRSLPFSCVSRPRRT